MLSLLDDRVFRANPNYELVLLDRLPVEERDRLASLRRESDLYGVVRPRANNAAHRTIAASREVALLIFTLQQPGALPSYLCGADDPHISTIISQLVLDGVLEIASDAGFISGSAALALLQPEPRAAGGGRIAALSRDAVTYAARIDATEPTPLEVRLYMYNRRPVTPALTEQISGNVGLRRFLGIDTGALASALGAQWRSKAVDSGEGWIHWSSRNRGNDPLARTSSLYKLYISPTLERLPEIFPVVVRVLTDAEAPTFKIGTTLHGITRSDKLVAYFESRADALECGDMLCRELEGTPAQGVPFTAEIGGDGLVSWGVDPPRSKGGDETQSWRGWICRRLAHYLFAAREAPDAQLSPADFALRRLELDGIDTTNWVPDVARLERPAASRNGA